MSWFTPYKPGQAKTSRTVTFLCGACLAVWGARSYILTVPRFHTSLGRSLNVEFLGAAPAEGWVAPLGFMESTVSIALVTGVLLLLAVLVWWSMFLRKPKYADMLIDMEGELKKVSWPNSADAWQSTLVVTGCTVLLVGLLVMYDFVINRFMMLFVSV